MSGLEKWCWSMPSDGRVFPVPPLPRIQRSRPEVRSCAFVPLSGAEVNPARFQSFTRCLTRMQGGSS